VHFLLDPFSAPKGAADVSGTAVIGIGSPFGADQLGWEVVTQLRDRGVAAEFECWDGPLAGLVKRFKTLDLAILVDAAVGGGRVGEVRILAPEQLEGAGLLWSSHGFGLPDAVALAQALDELPGRLVVVAAEVGESTTELPPKAAVRAAVYAVESQLAIYAGQSIRAKTPPKTVNQD
jgi:hydrogenase maturation protease